MRFGHLLVCSLFIFFVLYAPQPLLSLFAEQFSVSPATAGLLLAKRNPLTILRYAMLVLAVTCVAFAYAPSFELLLLLRFLQGLTLPAALTAMTTYIGSTYQADSLQKNMTFYIGSTIAGGYFGRVLAAIFADLWTWQSFYFVIAAGLISFALSIPRNQTAIVNSTLSPLNYLKQLANAAVLKLYGAVFCMFFCFAALLNYLPFIVCYICFLQHYTSIFDELTISDFFTGIHWFLRRDVYYSFNRSAAG